MSTSRSRRLLAIAALVSVLVTGTIFGQASSPASAASYPSWGDVQAAQKSVAAKNAEIKKIDDLLAGLKASAAAAQSLAEQKGAAAQAAQQKHDEAALDLTQKRSQADAAKAKAAKSKQEAGQFAAQLARTGGSDLSTTLFFSGDAASDLLSQLGLASMVKDRSADLYTKATQDENTAKALADQAGLAEAALQKLADTAQNDLKEATAASEQASAALAEQQSNEATLQAQRTSLVTNQNVTQAQYNAGVAAAAKAAAQQQASHPSGGTTAPGSGPSAGSGSSTSGWVRPSAGHMTSPYGYRVDPYTHDYALHSGTDLAPGCGAAIVAAHSGTVTYAGPYGGYGNYVKISNNDGSGVSTAYGHIVNGGIQVSVNQQVSAGQRIASVGSTGWSTGCHLHFEVYLGGTTTDPVPFMRARGVELAN
ncbi:MAG TPA: peptidoglycan DD-metalloendopeptidase family protein [Lacisediminihabitans sp.]|uniref:M23 family metallopeptidase n=1 Tax=Lacisediminihabitans sp. TaxID=2787631 RepID=UPI002EDB16D3